MKKVLRFDDKLTIDKCQKIIIFLNKMITDYNLHLRHEELKLKKDFAKIRMIKASIQKMYERLEQYKQLIRG